MQAKKIYLLKCASAANTVFFENELQAKLFLNYVDKYLGDYFEIHGYQNNIDGWVLVATTRSEKEIFNAYKKRRSNSKKCKIEFEFTEIWRILSEQIRILQSCYVKATNFLSGRIGTKVRSNYQRFVFGSHEEALAIMKQMKEQKYSQAQKKRKYFGLKSHFDFTKKQIHDSIYMCCNKLKDKIDLTTHRGVCYKEKLVLKCLRLLDDQLDLLRQLVNSTFFTHFPSNIVNST